MKNKNISGGHLSKRKMHKAVLFCPLTCLRRFVVKNNHQESEMLQDCFQFDNEVQPGWIQYDPQEITVLACNDSLRPLGPVNDIVDVNKQMISVKNEAELEILRGFLAKPVMMCVTRRHQCPDIANTSRSDSMTENLSLNLFERELRSMNGFDIDFAVIFPPGVVKDLITETLEKVKDKIDAKRKYCFTVDLKEMMKKLTPPELQDQDSFEYVSWHNTAFWITNHSKPHHSLMYVNGLLFWTVLFPFSLFVALPYRVIRKISCKDAHVDLQTALKFTAEPKETVAVYVWFLERPPPGAYIKHAKDFSARTATVAELKPFVQDCNIISFNFGGEDV